jgi:hypothetical protein
VYVSFVENGNFTISTQFPSHRILMSPTSRPTSDQWNKRFYFPNVPLKFFFEMEKPGGVNAVDDNEGDYYTVDMPGKWFVDGAARIILEAEKKERTCPSECPADGPCDVCSGHGKCDPVKLKCTCDANFW